MNLNKNFGVVWSGVHPKIKKFIQFFVQKYLFYNIEYMHYIISCTWLILHKCDSWNSKFEPTKIIREIDYGKSPNVRRERQKWRMGGMGEFTLNSIRYHYTRANYHISFTKNFTMLPKIKAQAALTDSIVCLHRAFGLSRATNGLRRKNTLIGKL